jgi:ADP-heptose:LPS heptosyltransferase
MSEEVSEEVSITITKSDAELLLNLANQVSAQGKESLLQMLRIIHRLEAVVPEKDEDKD